MMQDKSTDKQATWDFVERRIAEVMKVGAILNKNKDLTAAVGGGVASIIQGVMPTKIDDSEILAK